MSAIEEFTKVTSVQSEENRTYTSGTFSESLGLSVGHGNDQLTPENKRNFTIITFVENDEDKTTFENPSNGLFAINPVYDVSEVVGDNGNEIVNGSLLNGENGPMVQLDTDENKEYINSIETVLVNKRNTVIVENEEVELRASVNIENKGLQSRPPTWRRNQKFVSEAFGFLQSLDAGDRNSGTDVDNFDHACENTIENCSVCNACEHTNQNVDQSKAVKHFEDQSETLTQNKDGTESQMKTRCDEKTLHSCDIQTTDTNCNGDYEPDEGDAVTDLPGLKKLLGRKRGNHSGKDDDGDSSDEDTGVYRESFRKSTWLYIGDNEEIKQEKNIANYISLSDLGLDTCDDSIFDESEESPSSEIPSFPEPRRHKRNESTTTTASENEFRKHFNSVSRRVVQRKNSQQEYKRLTTRCYDNMKAVTLHRDPKREFGIHILDCSPAIISGVDAGSPAEAAGLKEGQIVISVNGVNVLQASHSEIIKLVHRDSTTLTLELGSGDMTSVLDLQKPVITGYLKKQTSSTILKTWKRRYFILRKDDCLYYYKTEKETDPLGAIPLNGYTVSRYGDQNKFGFRAEKFGAKASYFMAETRSDMTNWVVHLNEAAKKGSSKDSWMDVTANNVGLPALNIRNPDCSGYLFKIGRATRRWRKRYCVLKDACIYYYKSANSKEADGVAHLHGYTVEDSGVHGKKHSFSLQPPEPEMRTFSFYTDNDTDKDRWVKALTTSIKKWIKVD